MVRAEGRAERHLPSVRPIRFGAQRSGFVGARLWMSASRRALLAGTALIAAFPLTMMALLATAPPALADGGQGGNANLFTSGASGAIGVAGANGSDGGNNGTTDGGGTGAGGGAAGTIQGGHGGTGGSGANGNVAGGPQGAGGTGAGAAGGDGGAGGTGAGGGGGGGGGGGTAGNGATGTITGSVTGGKGGKGGDGGTGTVANGGGGGGGGGGGIGAIVTTSVDNGFTVTGGAGGAGGAGGNAATGSFAAGFGGSGGSGGDGMLATSPGLTILNSGTITGGVGGEGGAAATIGPPGLLLGGGGGNGGNGVEVTGAGMTLTNSGTIAGGGGGAASNPSQGFGGSGGAGVVFTAVGATFTNTHTGSVSGGNGMAGIGIGGDGGTGVLFTAGATFTNSGTVTGGNGGDGGVINGAGGQGVAGADNLTVINSGTITAGLAGDGTRANAITYTGGVNLLELRAGSSITGNVVAFSAADTLRLGGSTNASFDVSQIGASAQYQGFGIFEKAGTSTWSLTGSSTGALPWTINAGSLAVDGTMANASMTVNNGGTLAGIGTVGNTQVNSGGTFAPGAPGTAGTSLTVAANLAFQSGALYLIQVNAAMASFANVTGTATLGGTVLAAGSFATHSYDILHAAGGLGGTTFNSVTVSDPNFKASLSYTPTDVFLNLTANLGGGAGSGLNGNQQNIATTINNFFNSGGSLPAGFANLLNLSGAPLANALTQISGETATGSQQTTFDAMNLFMGLLTDPFMNRTGGFGSPVSSGYAEGDAYTAQSNPTDAFAMFTKAPLAPFVQRWSVWAAGYGGSQTMNGNTVVGSNDIRSSIAGTALGADYLFSPNTIAGFALAGGGTTFSVANGGTGRSDLFQAGAYVRHNEGPAYISAALAYGWQDIITNRIVTVAGFDQLRAQFNANAWSGRGEGGYRFVAPVFGGVGIMPYAAGQFVTFDLPAYMEQAIIGNNTFALGYNAKSVTDGRSELGIRTDKSIATQDGIFTLRGRLAWAHDFDPDRNILATFQTLPGASFVVNGAIHATDSALATASIEWKWINGWSAAATFESEFSNVSNSYAGKGVVRHTW